MKYKVYFEFFGRKMQHDVEAGSIDQAKHIIEKKIIFHKVEKVRDDVDDLMDIFGMKR